MSSAITRIDRYELRSVLARTAMSTVHDGWDTYLARRVAVKIIDTPASSHPEVQDDLARFRRGAQAAGQLVHPNIAAVYDYGETEDRAYIVMEFIDGPTLRELFDQSQRFTLEEISRIVGSILEALQYSHAHAVVHRDIKPANVMFTADMVVKLTDFGIARLDDSDVTQTGTIVGTPAYMSPEQFLGEKVDWRSDIYSTGVILYQMLTGERPYEGTLATIMHKVLYTTLPPPSGLSSLANPALDQVVARAMAKHREERFESVAEFLAALKAASARGPRPTASAPPEALGSDARIPGRSSSTRRYETRQEAGRRVAASVWLADRRRVAAIGGGLLAALLVVGGAAYWLLASRPAPRIVATSVVPTGQPKASPLPVAPSFPTVGTAASTPLDSPRSTDSAGVPSEVPVSALREPPAAAAGADQPDADRPAGQPELHNVPEEARQTMPSAPAPFVPPVAVPADQSPLAVPPIPPAPARNDEARIALGGPPAQPAGRAAPREDTKPARPAREPAGPQRQMAEVGRGFDPNESTLPSWLRRGQPSESGAIPAPPPSPSGAAPQSVAPELNVPTISSNGKIGLLCRAITPDSAPNFGLESAKGMEVIGVTSGSPAASAGIRMHDIIFSIGGVATRDLAGLPRLARSEPTVPVELQRDRKRKVVQLPLDKLRN